MKKITTLLLATIGLAGMANAQQSLPYSTGFDNATEKRDGRNSD